MSGSHRMSVAAAACALGLGMLFSQAAFALPKITSLTAKCICGCEGAGSGTVPLVQFAAPAGDPNGCGNMNGTQCKANGAGGKLVDCVGRVTDEKIIKSGTTATLPKPEMSPVK